ncbi:9925_t:CDS:2, partial [Dentiscutata erythropus]
MVQSILSENTKYFYFILICLFTLWHKIDSTSRTEAKKIEAILALNNEIRNDITGLRNDITGIRSDITGIHENITGIRNDITGICSSITGIRNDITGMRNDITGIHDDINRIRGTSNFSFAYLYILYHRINSISQTETEKIEAILALTNEIRDNINIIHNTSRTEHKKIISELSININRICETSKKENEEIGKTLSNLTSDLRKDINEIREIKLNHISQAGLNQFSITNSINTRQISICYDTETLRSKFKSLVDQRKERDRLFLDSIFDEVASKVNISKSTVYNFYHHRTSPRETTKNEILKWVNGEVGRNNNLNNHYNSSW